MIRISKYNPAYRDKDGAYLIEEWTSISDVGKMYGGNSFLFPEYKIFENKYIKAIKLILKKKKKVRIHDLEKYSCYEKYFPDKTLKILHSSIQDGDTILTDEIDDLLKLILRECLWCNIKDLEGSNVLSFGYDYYLYVSSDYLSKDLIDIISMSGLYVDVE